MFNRTPRPAYCPWGAIQEATEVLDGIWLLSTASHGGFHVSQERLDASEFLKEWTYLSFNRQGTGGWFEEDCDWCFIPLAFSDEWKAARGERGEEEIKEAKRTFDQWIAPKAA